MSLPPLSASSVLAQRLFVPYPPVFRVRTICTIYMVSAADAGNTSTTVDQPIISGSLFSDYLYTRARSGI